MPFVRQFFLKIFNKIQTLIRRFAFVDTNDLYVIFMFPHACCISQKAVKKYIDFKNVIANLRHCDFALFSVRSELYLNFVFASLDNSH